MTGIGSLIGHSRSYDLTFEQRRGYLYACVQVEEADAATVRSYLRDLAVYCAAYENNRLMIDRRLTIPLSDGEISILIWEFTEWAKGSKVVVVDGDNVDDFSRTIAEFGLDDGDGRFEVKGTLTEAEDWLLRSC